MRSRWSSLAISSSRSWLIAAPVAIPDSRNGVTRAAELERRIDPDRRLGAIAVGAKVYEGIPEIAEILRKHGISGREYMLTESVAMVTAMTDATLTGAVLRHEGWKEIPTVFMTEALKFWRSMDPALKAEADEWAKTRGYDKGISR